MTIPAPGMGCQSAYRRGTFVLMRAPFLGWPGKVWRALTSARGGSAPLHTSAISSGSSKSDHARARCAFWCWLKAQAELLGVIVVVGVVDAPW